MINQIADILAILAILSGALFAFLYWRRRAESGEAQHKAWIALEHRLEALITESMADVMTRKEFAVEHAALLEKVTDTAAQARSAEHYFEERMREIFADARRTREEFLECRARNACTK